MSAFVAAGAGFLLAVLWFDLMFDVQVIGHGGGQLPASVLDSIGGYYARVTTGARPMNRLIAAVMLGTLGAIVAEIVNGKPSPAVAYTSLALAAFAILLAGLRTVPSAVRLGSGRDNVVDRVALARAILYQHVLCFAAIVARAGASAREQFVGPPSRQRAPRQTPIATYLTSKYSSIPSKPPSRPNPDCLTPPNGAAGFDTTPWLSPTMPDSSRSQTWNARSRSRV